MWWLRFVATALLVVAAGNNLEKPVPMPGVIMLCLFLPLLLLAADATRQVEPVCPNGYCMYLVIRDDHVRFIGTMSRDIDLGSYARSGQRFVPQTEAPIRDLRTKRGWHIVISEFLEHKEAAVETKFRFFSPRGELMATNESMMDLELAQLGYLLGGRDEILAITTNEEHVYNARTMLWLLPDHGTPKQLLDVGGMVRKFLNGADGKPAGVWIDRQTYDGFHAETKGWAREFWKWNADTKTLTSRHITRAISSLSFRKIFYPD
jgi:hypothetical protein